MSNRQLFVSTLALVAALSAAPLYADNVTLKSGDSLSGTIQRVGPDTVDLDTSYAGLIKIKRDQVRTLRSDAKVPIVNAQGQTHTAYISPLPEATGWHESDAASPPPAMATVAPAVPTPPTTPTAQAAAKAVCLNLEPWYLRIGPHWKNQFVLGILATSGNNESSSLAAEANFKYSEKPHEITLKIGANYAETNGAQTANQAYFDGVFRRTFPEFDKSDRWYAFGENHELYDAIKDISLRSTTAFGPGYYFFKGPKFKLDLHTGPAFVYERFFDRHTTTDIDALLGLRAEYIINDRTSLTEDALYTTAIEDANRYQVTSDTALAFKVPEIARGAGLKLDFRDDYDNAASAGSKRNDTRFTLALTLDF